MGYREIEIDVQAAYEAMCRQRDFDKKELDKCEVESLQALEKSKAAKIRYDNSNVAFGELAGILNMLRRPHTAYTKGVEELDD